MDKIFRQNEDDIRSIGDNRSKEVRTTLTHSLAAVIKKMYPDVKLGDGEVTDNGFYYDFLFPEGSKINAKTVSQIENELKLFIGDNNHKFNSYYLPIEVARHMFASQPFKLEIIKEMEKNGYTEIPVSQIDSFIDIGTITTKKVSKAAILVNNPSSAYWKGNKDNKMLQRIEVTAFPTKNELDQHLRQIEDLKKRDHAQLGRAMGIFTTVEEVGQGLPLLKPRGAKIIQTLQRFVEDEEDRRGYMLTKTPFMAKSDLYKISGHWDHYRDGMFIINNDKDDELALRPMTCPFQFMIYKDDPKTIHDLPARYNETSTLFRNESSGEMHGLIRVRQFTLSEGHIICAPEQLEDEFKGVINLINYFMDVLGIKDDVTYRFSKWDPNNKEKYLDNPEAWERSQTEMKGILDKLKFKYEEAVGEAAFYGPKLDIQFKNVHGKEDTIITVQIDFELAERFGLKYTDKDGKNKTPMIIHRSSIGCYERTLAMLLEKYAGKLPLWLSPEQARIATVVDNRDSDEQIDSKNQYAKIIESKLKKIGIRASNDLNRINLGKKVKKAIFEEKVPYLVVIGDKEVEDEMVTIKNRDTKETQTISIDDFLSEINKENKELSKELKIASTI